MNQIILLRQTLKPLLGWRGTRLNFLALFLIALLRVTIMNLVEIATGFRSKATIDSNYKRLQRFFSKFDLDYTLIAQALVRGYINSSQLRSRNMVVQLRVFFVTDWIICVLFRQIQILSMMNFCSLYNFCPCILKEVGSANTTQGRLGRERRRICFCPKEFHPGVQIRSLSSTCFILGRTVSKAI